MRQRLKAGVFRKQGNLEEVHSLQAPQSLSLLLLSMHLEISLGLSGSWNLEDTRWFHLLLKPSATEPGFFFFFFFSAGHKEAQEERLAGDMNTS